MKPVIGLILTVLLTCGCTITYEEIVDDHLERWRAQAPQNSAAWEAASEDERDEVVDKQFRSLFDRVFRAENGGYCLTYTTGWRTYWLTSWCEPFGKFGRWLLRSLATGGGGYGGYGGYGGGSGGVLLTPGFGRGYAYDTGTGLILVPTPGGGTGAIIDLRGGGE